jgi:RNA polymerase sigma-70 factor (ECF subfamily)
MGPVLQLCRIPVGFCDISATSVEYIGGKTVRGSAVTPREVEELAANWTGAQRTVAGFVRTLATDFHESEEILQRVAVTLVRKYEQYDRNRSFVAWAIGIAKLEALAFLRERSRDRLVFDDALVAGIAESHERAAQTSAPIPQFLTECIEELDGRSRLAIQLRYGEDLRTAQIASALKISDGAARMLLSRARTLLRRCVEAHAVRWEDSP